MATMVQIRNVPDAFHRRLKARAAHEGMSMSDYILREVGKALAHPAFGDPHLHELGDLFQGEAHLLPAPDECELQEHLLGVTPRRTRRPFRYDYEPSPLVIANGLHSDACRLRELANGHPAHAVLPYWYQGSLGHVVGYASIRRRRDLMGLALKPRPRLT